MTYPETRHGANETFCYTFTIYQKDGEKFYLDYYTLDGAKEMAKLLDADCEVFSCMKDMGDGSLEEVKESWTRN